MVQYITDMLLELRNMVRLANLPTLLGLLELSFCETFSIANKVKIPDGEIKNSSVWRAPQTGSNSRYYKGLTSRKCSLFVLVQ